MVIWRTGGPAPAAVVWHYHPTAAAAAATPAGRPASQGGGVGPWPHLERQQRCPLAVAGLAFAGHRRSIGPTSGDGRGCRCGGALRDPPNALPYFDGPVLV